MHISIYSLSYTMQLIPLIPLSKCEHLIYKFYSNSVKIIQSYFSDITIHNNVKNYNMDYQSNLYKLMNQIEQNQPNSLNIHNYT